MEMESDTSIAAECSKDDSVELELNIVKLKSAFETPNSTKSVFNISLNDSDIIPPASESSTIATEIKDYEAHLQQELKDWSKLWIDTVKQLRQMREKHPPADISLLSVEQRAYLNKAPCFQKFLRDSREFQQAAHIYLEKDYAEMLEMQQNVLQMCEHRMNGAKYQQIVALLANKTPKQQ